MCSAEGGSVVQFSLPSNNKKKENFFSEKSWKLWVNLFNILPCFIGNEASKNI